MLRSTKSLRGYNIMALDGEIGKVHEFYFDDLTWIIRYMVADTGNWLLHHMVLISPQAMEQPDWESQVIPLRLKKEQVENSPPIRADKPVSRQMENDLHRYYGWLPYWTVRGPTTVPPIPREGFVPDQEKEMGPPDFNLRRTREVNGYNIRATDGEIGHVDDFIMNDDAWDDKWYIRYIVVDTGTWLPGKKVLIDPAWVIKVNWPDNNVYLNLSRDDVKNSPEYDPSEPINRAYEARLYDYYGRPKYWE